MENDNIEKPIDLVKGQHLCFEEYHGQYETSADFMVKSRGYYAFFSPDKIIYSLFYSDEDTNLDIVQNDKDNSKSDSNHLLKKILTKRNNMQAFIKSLSEKELVMKLEDAKTDTVIKGEKLLPGKINYYKGKNSNKDLLGIPTYAEIRYKDVYPGIDMVYFDNQGQLEFSFILREGSNPKDIRFSFTGANTLKIDKNGTLLIDSGKGIIKLLTPYVYQEDKGNKIEIACSYYIKDENQVSFVLGEYDSKKNLNIDPVIIYSTYYGTNFYDFTSGIKVDTDGNMYFTGYSPTAGGNNVFVVKMSNDGKTRIYETMIEGESNNMAFAIALDSQKNVYITGATDSEDFETHNPYQAVKGNDTDAFVTKLDNNGQIIYSTFLGGDGDEFGYGIACDEEGNAYITGETNSTDFPTNNPYMSYSPDIDGINGFVTKISSDGSQLIYSTYLGGSDDDVGYGIAVDRSNQAYVTGYTISTDFPVTDSYQTQNKGSSDAFVIKLNASGTALIYSTYLGGSDADTGTSIAVDKRQNAYVCGTTSSVYFPLKNPYQNILRGTDDVFITKLDSKGKELIYSTYIGGTGSEEQAYSKVVPLVLDEYGNAYIAGTTDSKDFPLKYPIREKLEGDYDAFLLKLDQKGNKLMYSTYLGGDELDSATGIDVDKNGVVYVSGITDSRDFPLVDEYNDILNELYSSFIMKVRLQIHHLLLSVEAPVKLNIGNQLVYKITVTNQGPEAASGADVTSTIPKNTSFISASLSNGSYSYSNGVVTFNIGSLEVGTSVIVYIIVLPLELGEVSSTFTMTSEGEVQSKYVSTLVIDEMSQIKATLSQLKSYLDRNNNRINSLIINGHKEKISTGIVYRSSEARSLVVVVHNVSNYPLEAKLRIYNMSNDRKGKVWWSKDITLDGDETKRFVFAVPPRKYEFIAYDISQPISILIGERSDSPETPIDKSHFIETNIFRLNNMQ